MEVKEFKNLFENHNDLRKSLIDILTSSGRSITNLSREIGINPQTLKSFLIEKKHTDLVRMMKINKFVSSRSFN